MRHNRCPSPSAARPSRSTTPGPSPTARCWPDGHAGPAATGPRDHARAGAAVRRRGLLLYALAAAPFPALAAALAVLVALPLLAGSGAPADGPGDGPGRRLVCWRSAMPRCAPSCAGCWPPRCWRPALAALPWTPGTGARCPGRQTCWASRASGCGSCGRPGRWRCGRCGAGAASDATGTLGAAGGGVVALLASLAMGGSDRALMLACPAGGAGGLCAAHAQAQRRGGHRLVLDVLLQRLRPHHLGHLRGHADRVPPSRRPTSLRLAPGFEPSFSLLACWPGRGWHAGLAVAGALAHRPPPRSAVEEPGAAGRRRGPVLAAADDLLAAAAGLRAQLPAAGRRIAEHVPASACVAAPQVLTRLWRRWNTRPLAGRRDAITGGAARCDYLLAGRALRASAAPIQAGTVAACKRPTDRDENHRLVYRRRDCSPTPLFRRAARVRPACGGSGAKRTRVRPADEPEARALAGLALDVDLAAVALHHVLDDRQAQPGAAGVARAAAVHAVEALGQPRHVLARDAEAGVGDRSPVRHCLRARRQRTRRCARPRACSARRC
jgi:hypothetical protein